MRIAYLILAHNNAEHLQRLVKRLAAPGAAFFVHLDAKADIGAFAALAPDVSFCQRRIDCGWGDVSLVTATLELMRTAAGDARGFDYFCLLSGACYPLQTPAYIEAYLERHRGTEFIEAFALPNLAYHKPIERLTRYWIRKGKPLARLRWMLQRWMNKVMPLRDYKPVLDGGEPVTGSQWWCLSAAAVRHVLEFTERKPALYRFCRYVDCPDEFYFQTVMWNSPLRERISHSLSYTDWAPGKASPETIDASYLPQFGAPVIRDSERNNCPNEKREVLFARKFSEASGPLLDAIDALAAQRLPAGVSVRDLVKDEVHSGQD